MTDLDKMGQDAVDAKFELQRSDVNLRNTVLKAAAEALVANTEEILQANMIDIENGKKNNMSEGLLDRLKLNSSRIEAMSEGILQISELPDCIGEVIESFERPNGLKIEKVRVPMGVIGIIYEARPNVTADAFALCFKTANAVILKGGSDALHSNIAIVNVFRNVLADNGINQDLIQLITDTDRAITTQFMRMNKYVDLLIPRGGAGLIRNVVENSTIPVIETGTGNCHVYVDYDADIDMAVNIIMNAKTQRIGVCNACESLVIHKDIREKLLPKLREALLTKNVEMRVDEGIAPYIPESIPATTDDFGKEYLDYIISMKTVENIDEAIEHINKYNTRHSETIVTNDSENANKFLNEIDAACVYVNASTRFTDGFEFGFGAEIGISTQKLHARGPMGLKEITSYKYLIRGNGQTR